MNQPYRGLAFLPLGGTGEIGMNLSLYRLDDTWLAVDCGIGFAGSSIPEADIIVPDPQFIARQKDKLAGLIITHAHEDHIGAVAHLWPYLQCAVWLTPFASIVLKRKLSEANITDQVKLHSILPGSRFNIGPFDLQFIPVNHSIPEAQSLVLRSPYGTVLHTGDWKIDTSPLIEPKIDLQNYRSLGEEGVLAIVSDSTNVMTEGPSHSENEVRKTLFSLVPHLKGRIVVTCFASNIARIESIALAAKEANRRVVLVGHSLYNMVEAAKESGYLSSVPEFLTERDLAFLHDNETLMIATGSQGEPRSALTRIAKDAHNNISLRSGDAVIYSSRIIPGNEHAVLQTQEELIRRNIQVITERDKLVHVSGHATGEDLKQLYQLVKPQYCVPVHGEWRHMNAQAILAQKMGISPILLEDGKMLSLSDGEPDIIDTVPVGRLIIDGTRLIPLQGKIMSARRRMLYNGVAVASIVMDKKGHIIGKPQVSAPGLLDIDDINSQDVIQDFLDAVSTIPHQLRCNEDTFKQAIKTALRHTLRKSLQKRPLIEVHLLHV